VSGRGNDKDIFGFIFVNFYFNIDGENWLSFLKKGIVK
jgi:hypothetical protein